MYVLVLVRRVSKKLAEVVESRSTSQLGCSGKDDETRRREDEESRSTI